MGNYATNLIDKKNDKVLKALKSNSNEAATKALASIKSIADTIENYKTALSEYIDLSVEQSAITAKYSKDVAGGSYNLPGVFSNTVGGYNIEQMKKDNLRLRDVSEQLKAVEAAKDFSSKIISRNATELLTQLKIMSKTLADVDAYLAQLEEFSSWETNSLKR